MSLEPFWTIDAEETFAEILDHLLQEWGRAVALAFHAEVDHMLGSLCIFPGGGVMEVPELNIRSIPVARQVRLFYRVNNDRLILLVFLDVRTQAFQRLRERE